MAIAVACKQSSQPTSSTSTCSAGIGARIIGHKNTKLQSNTQEKTLNYRDRSVSGIAICFGGKDVFYINLNQGMIFSAVVHLLSDSYSQTQCSTTVYSLKFVTVYQ
jgi:hypothetical protein